LALPLSAEQLTLPGTEVRQLTSKSNGIDYKIYVYLPNDYATSNKSYRVVYLLDADYSFPIARGIIEHMSDRNRLPRLILIGVAYGGPRDPQSRGPIYRRNRTRDYTPVFSPDGGYGPEFQKYSGGGPKFAAFLRDELIPLVDSEYRTVRGDRALVGHSYGGLFTSWMLLTAPDLFTRHIVVSPSLWYHDRMMFDLETKTRGAKRPPSRSYFAVGARESTMPQDLTQFANHLRARKMAGFAIRHEIFNDEHHDSVFATALSRGLRFVFEGD
jgi:predicted alpha/beta superfamily hydrolase